ncbi:MAG: hypothetical protein ABIQ04_01350 [Candidatus Saccharimonadales bacterium]
MDGSVVFFFVAILVVGAILFAVITLTKRGGSPLNVDKYRVKWLAIEQQLKRDEPSSCQLAVLNADKLLDQALRERGYRGQTMGERMKSAHDKWTSRDGVWRAHKLRNQIAHESDVRVSYDEARSALGCFKQALKDLGAI